MLHQLACFHQRICPLQQRLDVVTLRHYERAYPMLQRIRDLGQKLRMLCRTARRRQTCAGTSSTRFSLVAALEWKLSQLQLTFRQLPKRGKWVHMGRVNSCKRIRLAAVIGCSQR